MKFLVEIKDKDVTEAIKDQSTSKGPMTPETLILWSLEENFGIPGDETIKVTKIGEQANA